MTLLGSGPTLVLLTIVLRIILWETWLFLLSSGSTGQVLPLFGILEQVTENVVMRKRAERVRQREKKRARFTREKRSFCVDIFSTVVVMNQTTIEAVWNINQLKEREECVHPEKTSHAGASPDRPACRGQGRCAAQVDVGGPSVVEAELRWNTHSSFLAWWKICNFYTVAEQMELWLMIHNLCGLILSIMFLTSTELYCIQLHGETLQRPGEALCPYQPWSQVHDRCLFIYLSAFTEPKSLLWAGRESQVAYRTIQERPVGPRFGWETRKERKSWMNYKSQNPAQQ